MNSAKEMFSKLKEIISTHVTKEEELNSVINGLTVQCSDLTVLSTKTSSELERITAERLAISVSLI